jgi:uncharacterized repeat protein (TIGR01451 family)
MLPIIKSLSITILLFISFLSYAQVNQFEWGISIGSNDDSPYSSTGRLIKTDTAGNTFIAGTFYGQYLGIRDTVFTLGPSNIGYRAFITKIDKNGEVKWVKQATDVSAGNSGPYITALILDEKGDCYLVGDGLSGNLTFDSTVIPNPTGSELYTLKIKNDGTFVWATMMGSIPAGNLRARLQSIDLHNGTVRVGGSNRIFYSKLDANSGALLLQEYPTLSPLETHQIITDNQGDNYILDKRGADSSFVIGGYPFFMIPDTFPLSLPFASPSIIIKQDSAANTIWIKQFETEVFSILGIEVDTHGDLYVIGRVLDSIQLDSNTYITSDAPNNLDFFIAKFDQNLQVIWFKMLGGIEINTMPINGNLSDYDCYLELDPAGNIYVAVPVSSNKWIGNYQMIVPNNRITSAVVKLTSKGDIIWVKKVAGYNNKPQGLSISPKGIDLYGSVKSGEAIFNNQTVIGSSYPPTGFVTRMGNSTGTNLIQGTVFSDENENGLLDTSEASLPHALVNFNNDFYKSTNNLGNFSSYAFSNSTYQISPVVPLYWQHTTSDTTIVFNNTWDIVSGLEFGLKALDDIQDLDISVASTAIRPGFDLTYFVTYRNVGTKVMSGQVDLIIDDTLTYLSSNPIGTLMGNSISWNYNDLQVGESRLVKVFCQMPVALDLLETDIIATAQIEPIASDTTPLNNVFIHGQEVTGSYDPNDKQVSPSAAVSMNFVNNGTFRYTIRFQNTGNDTAFTVRIADTLNQHLDISSFQMIGASHAYDFELNNQAIIWTFNNILLPDSTTNEPESHGFIQYSIQPKNETKLNDTIANTAHIYFDFNPAIVTNTTINDVQLVSMVSKLEESQLETIHVFPNPTNGRLTCEVENYQLNTNYRFRVFDMAGRKVYEEQLLSKQQTMHLYNLSKGMYIFQVINDNNDLKGIGKILIQ